MKNGFVVKRDESQILVIHPTLDKIVGPGACDVYVGRCFLSLTRNV